MNYPYTSIKVINGQIKAVVNKEDKPLSMFGMDFWQQNHEVFEFANEIQRGKVITLLYDTKVSMLNLESGIEVTYIEIKDGLAWFKEENINTNKTKPFIVANVIKLLTEMNRGDISFSRMVEIMNEMAYEFYTNK